MEFSLPHLDRLPGAHGAPDRVLGAAGATNAITMSESSTMR
jgi:hypothetical protein